MTPAERAEKIFYELFPDDPIEEGGAVLKIFAAQIEEAVEEGKKEAGKTIAGLQTVMQRATDLTEGYDDGYAEGFKAAQERAAKICETYSLYYQISKDVPHIDCSYLAEKIRAMRPEGGEK